MATANYGRALGFYADMVNDPGHDRELHCHTYQAIKASVNVRLMRIMFLTVNTILRIILH